MYHLIMDLKLISKMEKWKYHGLLLIAFLLIAGSGVELGRILDLIVLKKTKVEEIEDKTETGERKREKRKPPVQEFLTGSSPFTERPVLPLEITAEVEITPLNLTLVGTLVGENSIAIIKNNSTGTTDLYRVNDYLPQDGAQIYRIEPTRVLIRRGDKIESLELFEKFPVSKGETSEFKLGIPRQEEKRERQVGEVDVRVRQIGEGKFEVSRDDLEKATSNLGLMMTQARIVPNIVAGEIKGYKIFAIKPGSIYDKIGIQNGDVIERINGMELTTPESALQFFQQLKNETRFVIDLERNGQKLTFTYNIR
jgi:general secretion pathway protein C